MTSDEAIQAIDTVLVAAGGDRLSDIDTAIVRSVWQGWTYGDMGDAYHWSEKTLKDRGSHLWRALSDALGEPVSKKNLKAAVERWHRANRSYSVSSAPAPHINWPYIDWGNAPEVPVFFGRTQELATLEERILHHRDRLVAIVGIAGVGKTGLSIKLGQGGIGKTDLSLTLARGLQQAFDCVVWRSLLDAPPIDVLLDDLIQVLSQRQDLSRPLSLQQQIQSAITHLRRSRCLLLLDNWETVLPPTSSGVPDTLHQRHADYGQLLHSLGSVAHQSCVLITSRETPPQVARLVNRHPVYQLSLRGLNEADGRNLFAELGAFSGSEVDWEELIGFYDGNPLALEIVARHIWEVFAGDIAAFNREGSRVFDDLETLLNWHFQRLTHHEQHLLYWIALSREPVSRAELQEDVLTPEAKAQVPRTLERLQRRLPLEKVGDRWTLQPVLMAYLTQRFTQAICQEIEASQPDLLLTHALLKTQAKDYIKAAQARLIVVPIAAHLQSRLRPEAIAQQMRRLLLQLKAAPEVMGYGAGNLINLCAHLGVDLTGYDFSQLPIWQADLQAVALHRSNFAQADFHRSSFARTLLTVYTLAVSPTGNTVAIGDTTGSIRLYRTADGQLLRLLKGHSRWIRGVAFSPDEQWLVSGSWDCTLRLWNLQTGQCNRVFHGHTQTIYSVAVCPKAPLIASGSYDGTIRLWDLQTGVCLRTIQGWGSPKACSGDGHVVFSVCFSPDGAQVISAHSDGMVKVWQVATGACLHCFTEPSGPVWSVTLSRDGTCLACGCLDGSLWLWRLSATQAGAIANWNGQALSIPGAHRGLIGSVALSSDGQVLASGSSDDTLKLWNTTTGDLLHGLQGHQGWVWSVDFVPDAPVVVSGSVDQSVRFWDVETGRCLKVLRGYYNLVFGLAFVGDRRIVSANAHYNDNILHLWDTETGECLHTLQGHTRWIVSLLYSDRTPLNSERLLISSSQDRTIRLWDLEAGQCINVLQGHEDAIFCIALSPDHRQLASASLDCTVKLWNLADGSCTATLHGHRDIAYATTFLSSGKLVASAGMESLIRVWDTTTGACLRILKGHGDWIWTLAASSQANSSLLASGSHDTTVRLWNAETGECHHILQGHTDWVLCVTFSPDGTQLASASHDGTVRLWDVTTGQCLKVFHAPQAQLIVVAFSPDGKAIAAGGHEELIVLWDIDSGKVRQTLRRDRLYEGMQIAGATGLTAAQRQALRAFGAVESQS
ncbi:MAG: WD40 repeat domain-containing protein [Cyanobacteria bacterium P01_A01_bin.135]